MDRKKFKLSIFIFRRDFRLYDNTGLINAAKQSQMVIPCFIFDPKQSKKNNTYFAHNCFQFMVESLKDLDKDLKTKGSKLYIFQGPPEQIVSQIIKQTKAEAVFVNKDYTPYSVARDHLIRKQCTQLGVSMYSQEDILLIPIKDLPLNFPNYKKFTPFYNRLSSEQVNKVDQFDDYSFFKKKISFESKIPDHDYNKYVPLKGGRQEGLKLLNDLPKNYEKIKNNINLHNSNLSAHNKFGTISIRQFYYAPNSEPFRRQLYWRDFYYHVMISNSGFSCVQKKYQNITWKGQYNHLQLWKNGETGVPIVDAGMRELKKTGYIHNRLRMIVGSFLVKDLLIDWRQGQLHFAHYLIDYDPAQNNGNWQWVASTGTDSQPYFRIFNPKLQSQKFDPQCKYIKKWIPELKDVCEKSIHNWQTEHKKFKVKYPGPIVKHANQKQKALKLYKGYGTINNPQEEQSQSEEVQIQEKPKKNKKKN